MSTLKFSATKRISKRKNDHDLAKLNGYNGTESEYQENLLNDCVSITSLSSTFKRNIRRVGSSSIYFTVKVTGYVGTGTLLSLYVDDLHYDEVVFYNSITEQSSAEIENVPVLNDTTFTNYSITIPYNTSRANITVSLVLTLSNGNTINKSITFVCEETSPKETQMPTVDLYEDLPLLSTVSDANKDVYEGDNLIYGDYALTRFVKLTPSNTTTATDEFGTIHSFTDFSSYYLKDEITEEIELDTTITQFTVGTTYYAYRLRPWMWGGYSWVSAHDNDTVKMNTMQEVVRAYKAQHDNIDDSLDYHECLVAWDAFFFNLTASVITAEYIGAKNIKILEGGSIRGGDYSEEGVLTDPSGTGFFIGSNGRIDAINANLKRTTVDEDSIMKGTLRCGKTDSYGNFYTVLETELETGSTVEYLSHKNKIDTLPDGFFWSEVDDYFKGQLSPNASTSPWDITGTASNVPALNIKSSTGYINNSSLSNIIYASLGGNITIADIQYTNRSTYTPMKNQYITNPLPFPINVTVTIVDGWAAWSTIFGSGKHSTRSGWRKKSAGGTWSSLTLFHDYSSSTITTHTHNFTLQPNETLNIQFGEKQDPDRTWNEGNEPTYSTITVYTGLTQGMNYYDSNIARISVPTTGVYSIVLNDYGAMNIVYDNETQLNLVKALDSDNSWVFNSYQFTKLFKFSHTLGGVTPVGTGTNSFSHFLSNTAGSYTFLLYVKFADGSTFGSNSTTYDKLTSLLVGSSEASFTYNGVSESLSVGSYIREVSIAIKCEAYNRGIRTRDVFPLDIISNIGTSTNPYNNVHANDFYGGLHGNAYATGASNTIGTSNTPFNHVYANNINGQPYSNSSRKVKTNIKEFNGNALDILMKVLVSSFNYKFEIGTEECFTHYGFIAEDTPAELATKFHDRMDYGSCIGILIKAVQELSQKVSYLESLGKKDNKVSSKH